MRQSISLPRNKQPFEPTNKWGKLRMGEFPLFTVLCLFLAASSAQPAYPKYDGKRAVNTLDLWNFGFVTDFGDATRPLTLSDIEAIVTNETTVIPSVFDNQQPGILGRRGTAFYRTSFKDPDGGRGMGRLHLGGCSFYCRVFLDGVEVAEHKASGYTPFWVELGSSEPDASGAGSKHELLIMSDNRCRSDLPSTMHLPQRCRSDTEHPPNN